MTRTMMEKLSILNYHGFQFEENDYEWKDSEKPYVISTAVFDEQMSLLSKMGFASLDLEGLADWNKNGSSEKKIMLTFDDGHASQFENVVPVLLKYKMKAVFFVPAGLIGKKNQMGWSALSQLVHDGFEIGAHGLRHVPLSHLSGSELYHEIWDPKKNLEDHLGVPVKSFSVPYGFFSNRLRQMVINAGYRFLFNSHFDVNGINSDLFGLRRMVVVKGTSLKQFSALAQGHLGVRKYSELVKEKLRRLLGPAHYDILAGAKRAVASYSFIPTAASGERMR